MNEEQENGQDWTSYRMALLVLNKLVDEIEGLTCGYTGDEDDEGRELCWERTGDAALTFAHRMECQMTASDWDSIFLDFYLLTDAGERIPIQRLEQGIDEAEGDLLDAEAGMLSDILRLFSELYGFINWDKINKGGKK